jgi:hypothetical protein
MLTFIGITSGVVTLLVFLTGRPSIFHFLPIRRHTFGVPTPYVRWKFIVKRNTLFLRHQSLEIAVLPHLHLVKGYRIFSSRNRSKFLIVYKYTFHKRFEYLLVVNHDGSHRKQHHYPSGIVDARWLDSDSYLIYLEPASDYDSMNQYPYFWNSLNSHPIISFAELERRIVEGNYVVKLSAENEIIAVSNY